MNRSLINRLRHTKSEREKDGLERYVVCPIPHGEPVLDGLRWLARLKLEF